MIFYVVHVQIDRQKPTDFSHMVSIFFIASMGKSYFSYAESGDKL